MKKASIFLISLLILYCTSCVKMVEDTTPTITTTMPTEKVSENIVKIVPKADIKETEIVIKEDTKKDETIKEKEIEVIEEKIEETKVEETKIEETKRKSFKGMEEEIPSLDVGKYIYSNVRDEKIRSTAIAETERNVIDLNVWQYGMTPIDWVYIEPNIQLISNSKPNSSENFGYKVNASSGEKGCYIPVFSRCDMCGSDFEGRMYVYEDYTKIPIEEMSFNNRFDELMYRDYNVKELLKKKYNITDVSRGVVLAGDMYVNVVYVSELDEIIEGYSE